MILLTIDSYIVYKITANNGQCVDKVNNSRLWSVWLGQCFDIALYYVDNWYVIP